MNQPSAEHNNKIFVGSVPGYFRSKDLFRVFQGWGLIKKIKLNFKRDNPSLNKGYCVMTMQSSQDANTLLKQRFFHVGDGRYLVCKPFLQGEQLQDEILRHDLRRVILKQVPAELSEDVIKEFFEESIGLLEVLFVYLPDDRDVTEFQSRKWRTVSLTFKSEEDVLKLFPLESKFYETSLLINGHSIIAQRYKYQILSEEGLLGIQDMISQNPSSKKTSKLNNEKRSRQSIKNLKQGNPKLSLRPQQELAANPKERIIRDLAHDFEHVRFNIRQPLAKREVPSTQNLQTSQATLRLNTVRCQYLATKNATE